MLRTINVCVFGVFFFFVGSGNGLECYLCSSKLNEGCHNPVNSKLQRTTCDSDTIAEVKNFASSVNPDFSNWLDTTIIGQNLNMPMNCIKQVTRIDNKDVVIRGCTLQHPNPCPKILESSNDRFRVTHCSICDGDGCNSSPHVTPISIMTLLIQVSLLGFIPYILA